MEMARDRHEERTGMVTVIPASFVPACQPLSQAATTRSSANVMENRRVTDLSIFSGLINIC